MRSFAILQILALGLCLGQSADESKPASSNVMGAEYPRVFADGRAAFRLKAPEAQKVQVDIMAKKYDMAKGEDGFWTITIPPQVAGFHYYRLVVDGEPTPRRSLYLSIYAPLALYSVLFLTSFGVTLTILMRPEVALIGLLAMGPFIVIALTNVNLIQRGLSTLLGAGWLDGEVEKQPVKTGR